MNCRVEPCLHRGKLPCQRLRLVVQRIKGVMRPVQIGGRRGAGANQCVLARIVAFCLLSFGTSGRQSCLRCFKLAGQLRNHRAAVLLGALRQFTPGRLERVPLTGDRCLFQLQPTQPVLQRCQALVINPWIGHRREYRAKGDFAADRGVADGDEAFDRCAQRGHIGRNDRVVAHDEPLRRPDRIDTGGQTPQARASLSRRLKLNAMAGGDLTAG